MRSCSYILTGMDIAEGTTLDRRWTLRRLIARSSQATLYQANHAFLDRVASIVVALPEDRELLIREAKLRDQTYHPGVLGVLDVGDTREGVPYLVSEPLSGRSLDGLLLARGALPVEEAVRIATAIGEALTHVHERGIAHAALSPAGVLVDHDRAMLLDLGVFPTPMSSVVGPLASIPYTAPERLRGGAPPSPLTDVYALAAMLAEMLTGDPPGDWPPESRGFPERIANVVDRGLDDVGRRFETIEALLGELREAKSIEPPPPSIATPPKRAHPRVTYVTAARVRRPNGDSLDGRTENISEGGILVLGAGEVELGDAVLVRLALPSSGKIASEPGTVRWIRGGTDKSAFGVEFDDPTERTLADIRAYIDLMGGISDVP